MFSVQIILFTTTEIVYHIFSCSAIKYGIEYSQEIKNILEVVMKRYIKYFVFVCIGLLLAIQFVYFREEKRKQDVVMECLEKTIDNVQRAVTVKDQPYIPDSIIFFGGRIPLQYYGVWEDIDFWIRYYVAPKNRWRILSYLEIKERYFPRLDSILTKQGVSKDARYIALAESELNPIIVSSAKAKGGWQFITSTGKRNKLVINNSVDERLYFEKATPAACAELWSCKKEFGSFSEFDSWMFALASYNAGSGRVWQAIKKDGEKSYFLLSSLPKETSEYIPRIIALKLIIENPDRYGFARGVTFGGPHIKIVSHAAKKFESWSQLAKNYGISKREMQRANAHILNREGITKGEYTLRIPIRK